MSEGMLTAIAGVLTAIFTGVTAAKVVWDWINADRPDVSLTSRGGSTGVLNLEVRVRNLSPRSIEVRGIRLDYPAPAWLPDGDVDRREVACSAIIAGGEDWRVKLNVRVPDELRPDAVGVIVLIVGRVHGKARGYPVRVVYAR